MGEDDKARQRLLPGGQAWPELKPTARVEGSNATHWWKEWAFQEKDYNVEGNLRRMGQVRAAGPGAWRAKWSLVLMGASHLHYKKWG